MEGLCFHPLLKIGPSSTHSVLRVEYGQNLPLQLGSGDSDGMTLNELLVDGLRLDLFVQFLYASLPLCCEPSGSPFPIDFEPRIDSSFDFLYVLPRA